MKRIFVVIIYAINQSIIEIYHSLICSILKHARNFSPWNWRKTNRFLNKSLSALIYIEESRDSMGILNTRNVVAQHNFYICVQYVCNCNTQNIFTEAWKHMELNTGIIGLKRSFRKTCDKPQAKSESAGNITINGSSNSSNMCTLRTFNAIIYHWNLI